MGLAGDRRSRRALGRSGQGEPGKPGREPASSGSPGDIPGWTSRVKSTEDPTVPDPAPGRAGVEYRMRGCASDWERSISPPKRSSPPMAAGHLGAHLGSVRLGVAGDCGKLIPAIA